MMKRNILIIMTIIIVLVLITISGSFITINKLEINEYKINDNFNDIEIITDTSDIEFIVSESFNSLIVCNEYENGKHSVNVEGNNLLIKVNDNRKWYEYIGINFSTPKITIYLPKNEYGKLSIKSNTGDINISSNFKFKSIDILEDTGDVKNYASVDGNIKIKTSTGNIRVENLEASMIDLFTSTGKVNITDVNSINDIKINIDTGKTNMVNVNCKNLLSKGDTGNIFLENVIAIEKFSIERNTGDIKFKDCDASDIFMKTDTGNVKGNLLTDKVIFATSSTGKVDVPKIMADEKCEIITDTGNIKININ